MKILVVRTGPLFAHDETRLYAERLCKALAAAGHEVESTTIPFSAAIADIVPETTAFRLFDLRYGADLCIAIGPFSHALRHDNKRLWIFSQYGPFYEHWNTPFGAVTASNTNLVTREYVHGMDRAWISEARLVCAASATLAKAIFEQHEIEPKVLSPALLEDLESVASSHGDYLLAAGPLTETARLPLLLTAFGQSKTNAKLIILGYEFALEEREYIQQLVTGSSRSDSIALEFDPSHDRFRALVASAAGFVSTPIRAGTADAFTLAAGSAGKAVLTTKDSGEMARIIEDGVDGYVVDPDPAAVALAMDQIHGSRKLAEQLGSRLSEKLRDMLPSWESIAAELTK